MAKLMYEDDTGRRISFEIGKETLKDMKEIYNIDAWDEIWKSFKSEIQTLRETE